MVMSPRNVPRFLPTLTEVVHVPVPPPQAPSNEEPAGTDADLEAMAERVRWQVDAVMDRRFHEAVATVMLEQVDAIAARLRDEIEPLVRQTVEDVVAHEIGARRHD